MSKIIYSSTITITSHRPGGGAAGGFRLQRPGLQTGLDNKHYLQKGSEQAVLLEEAQIFLSCGSVVASVVFYAVVCRES